MKFLIVTGLLLDIPDNGGSSRRWQPDELDAEERTEEILFDTMHNDILAFKTICGFAEYDANKPVDGEQGYSKGIEIVDLEEIFDFKVGSLDTRIFLVDEEGKVKVQ